MDSMSDQPALCSTPRSWLDRIDRGIRWLRRKTADHAPEVLLELWKIAGQRINRSLPKGLLGRSLLIIVAPMMVLLAVLTGVFMDRHWLLVTDRLSGAVVRDISVLMTMTETLPRDDASWDIIKAAANRMEITVDLLPSGELGQSTLDTTDIVHRMLGEHVSEVINRPYTIQSASNGDGIEIRVPVANGTLAATFLRRLAYAQNWHFFLVWMAATASFLVLVSVVFIRNQIKPIQRLARAAEDFGKGPPAPDFSLSGAREVRQAALAFIEMRRRIDRQIEQRTTMLAGVSHDMRTVLTRFKLELALQEENEETAAMRQDVAEMESMLEAYLAFAKGDSEEPVGSLDLGGTLTEYGRRAERFGRKLSIDLSGPLTLTVRPGAFRRMLENLIVNALRYGHEDVRLKAERRDGWITFTVDDDGPGVPEQEREAVFRPFYRLDAARNQDMPGTGLGLAIARDVARSHGGDIRLANSPLGGLRVVVRLPG